MEGSTSGIKALSSMTEATKKKKCWEIYNLYGGFKSMILKRALYTEWDVGKHTHTHQSPVGRLFPKAAISMY